MRTVNQMLDKYQTDRLPSLTPGTRRQYVRHIKLLRERFGDKNLMELTRSEINEFMNVLRGKIHRNRILAVLSAAYTEALRWGWAEGNPCSHITRHVAQRHNRNLTDEEFEDAKAFARKNPRGGKRLALVIDLVRHTGQNQNYIVGLTWAQVHEREILFRHHITRKTVPVPITPKIRELLDQCKKESPDSKCVIPTQFGKRYTNEGFRAVWQRFCQRREAAGYERFDFHDIVDLARRKPSGAPAPPAADPVDDYPQFDPMVKGQAALNAPYYKVFFCLEQLIRNRISETMQQAVGADWWESDKIQQSMRHEVSALVTREVDSAMTQRSMRMIDYTTFGQLGQIIRDNWDLFERQCTSKGAVSSVLARLNLARGPIAHCCALSPLEIERLELTTHDWFNILKEP